MQAALAVFGTNIGAVEIGAGIGVIVALVVGLGAGFFIGNRNSSGTDRTPELDAIAELLGVPQEQRAVQQAIGDVVDSVDRVTEAVEDPTRYSIRPDDDPVARLSALARAVSNDDLRIVAPEAMTADAVGTDTSQGGETEKGAATEETTIEEVSVSDAVSAAERRTQLRTQAAIKLLDALSDPGMVTQQELTDSIVEHVSTLDEHASLTETIATLSLPDRPEVMATELEQAAGNVETPGAETLATVAGTLDETAQELETCRNERAESTGRIRSVCETAGEQTTISLGEYEDDPVAGLERLDTALSRGELWFVDNESSLTNLVADAETTADAQSQLAADLLSVLRDPRKRSDSEITSTLSEALEAIDRAETVSSRMEGVDSDAVVRTADRLLDDLDDEVDTVTEHLRDRVLDIKDTAERSSDVDMLSLYAARQELRYYDRTLIPQLSASEPSQSDSSTDIRLDEVEERRSTMRQSYPTEYPDCDHTIPIYFFDLVSELLETAEELDARGEAQRAAGLVDAADTTLDWIGGLYETHSYFVLLKQLRG